MIRSRVSIATNDSWKIIFIFTEAPTQILTHFIDEPQSPVFIAENATRELVWKVVNCDHRWQARIVTENYMLYPSPNPRLAPLIINTDYNVTETCMDDHKIVNFSITFNENVLESNIEYVTCKVVRSDDPTVVIPSRVNFTTTPISSTFNTGATTVTETDSTSSTVITVTTTGSGCSLSVHFMTLNLGLIVANSIFSWIC